MCCERSSQMAFSWNKRRSIYLVHLLAGSIIHWYHISLPGRLELKSCWNVLVNTLSWMVLWKGRESDRLPLLKYSWSLHGVGLDQQLVLLPGRFVCLLGINTPSFFPSVAGCKCFHSCIMLPYTGCKVLFPRQYAILPYTGCNCFQSLSVVSKHYWSLNSESTKLLAGASEL